jgi:hypothetical protein
MNTLRCALCVAVLLVACVVSPARAAPSPPHTAVFARSFWSPIEWALGSQKRMLQVATLAGCVALYIIWWRK